MLAAYNDLSKSRRAIRGRNKYLTSHVSQASILNRCQNINLNSRINKWKQTPTNRKQSGNKSQQVMPTYKFKTTFSRHLNKRRETIVLHYPLVWGATLCSSLFCSRRTGGGESDGKNFHPPIWVIFFIYISVDDKGAVLHVSSNWYLNIKKIKIFKCQQRSGR